MSHSNGKDRNGRFINRSKIAEAVSQDSKISLAGKCRRKAKDTESATSTQGQPTTE